MRKFAGGIAWRVAAGLAVAALALVASFFGSPRPAAVGEQQTTAVTIVATWSGQEETDFYRVLTAFHDYALRAYHVDVRVTYTGTRAIDQLVQSDVQQGNPPDIAILSSPGELLSYRDQGYLQPLDAALPDSGALQADYGPMWLGVMRLGTPDVYTLPVKANLHNLVWYNPESWPGVRMPGEVSAPTWRELTHLAGEHPGAPPWCLGLDSPPTSGWIGTDWIGDIMLHQSGEETYQRWAAGTLPWTSAPVRDAWTAWGSLVAGSGDVYGGSGYALLTGWDQAGIPLFGAHPRCYLEHVPSFTTVEFGSGADGYPAGLKAGVDYNFFPLPMTGIPGTAPGARNGAWDVSADLLAMFKDSRHPEAARMLVQFLASARGQGIWPGIKDGGASSADRQVQASAYPDPPDAAIAGIVTNPRTTLCYNASDLMPVTVQDAFYQGVLEYLQNPGQLMGILARIDHVRRGQPRQNMAVCGT